MKFTILTILKRTPVILVYSQYRVTIALILELFYLELLK